MTELNHSPLQRSLEYGVKHDLHENTTFVTEASEVIDDSLSETFFQLCTWLVAVEALREWPSRGDGIKTSKAQY